MPPKSFDSDFENGYSVQANAVEALPGDLNDAYMAGLVAADALFDTYFEAQSPAGVVDRGVEITRWDRRFSEKVCQGPESEGWPAWAQELVVGANSVPDGLEPTGEVTVPALSVEQRNLIFEGNIRLVDWFVRATVGYDSTPSGPGFDSTYAQRRIVPGASLGQLSGLPLSYSDRFQAASLGFLRAIETFDPTKGSLVTHSFWGMESTMVRVAREYSEDLAVRMTVAGGSLFRKMVYGSQLAAEQGALLDLDRLVEATGLEPAALEFMADRGAMFDGPISLEWLSEQIEAQEARRLEDGDGVDDEVFSLADRVRAQSDLEACWELEDDLTARYYGWELVQAAGSERNQQLVIDYWGLGSEQPKNQTQIGDEFGISPQAVSQILIRARDRLQRDLYAMGAQDPRVDHLDAFTGIGAGCVALSHEERLRLALPDPIRFAAYDRSLIYATRAIEASALYLDTPPETDNWTI